MLSRLKDEGKRKTCNKVHCRSELQKSHWRVQQMGCKLKQQARQRKQRETQRHNDALARHHTLSLLTVENRSSREGGKLNVNG
jgi:hypothetical protein